MLDPVVQSAFVVIVAWLLKLGAAALGIQLDDVILNTLAGVIVVFILSKLGVPMLRHFFPVLARRGLLSEK